MLNVNIQGVPEQVNQLRSFLKIKTLSKQDRKKIQETIKSINARPYDKIQQLITHLEDKYQAQKTTEFSNTANVTYADHQIKFSDIKDFLYPIVNAQTNEKIYLFFSSSQIKDFQKLDEITQAKFEKLVQESCLRFCAQKNQQGVKSLGSQKKYQSELLVNGKSIGILPFTHEIKIQNSIDRIGLCTLTADHGRGPTILYANNVIKKGLHDGCHSKKVFKGASLATQIGLFAQKDKQASKEVALSSHNTPVVRMNQSRFCI